MTRKIRPHGLMTNTRLIESYIAQVVSHRGGETDMNKIFTMRRGSVKNTAHIYLVHIVMRVVPYLDRVFSRCPYLLLYLVDIAMRVVPYLDSVFSRLLVLSVGIFVIEKVSTF